MYRCKVTNHSRREVMRRHVDNFAYVRWKAAYFGAILLPSRSLAALTLRPAPFERSALELLAGSSSQDESFRRLVGL